jgi:hypothetical protein
MAARLAIIFANTSRYLKSILSWSVGAQRDSSGKDTYRYARRLPSMNKLTLVDEIRIPFSWGVECDLAFPILVLVRCPIGKEVLVSVDTSACLQSLSLLLWATADICQVPGISRLDDIVSCEHGSGSNELQFFAEFEVSRVRWLVVIQKHQVDVLQNALGVQSLQRSVAGPNHDFDNIAQPSQIDQTHDDRCEFGTSLQAEILLASDFAKSVAKKNARVSDVTSELHHDLRLHFDDKVSHSLALVLSNIHEILLGASEIVYGREHLSGGASDGVDVVSPKDVVQQLDLSPIVKLDTFSKAERM